jgi:hypothetical protein
MRSNTDGVVYLTSLEAADTHRSALLLHDVDSSRHLQLRWRLVKRHGAPRLVSDRQRLTAEPRMIEEGVHDGAALIGRELGGWRQG